MRGEFAKTTEVSPEKTMQEIISTLKRYEATGFIVGEQEGQIAVAFNMCGRRVQFLVPLPDREDERFKSKVYNRYHNKGDFLQKDFDQAIRQRWRALLLVIKAKLESYDAGIEDFQDAFMAQLLLPDGTSMGRWAKHQIEESYANGKMPPLLGSGN